MKTSITNRITLLAFVGMMLAIISSSAQTTNFVIIDPTLTGSTAWQGYVNVFDLPPDSSSQVGGYEFGSAWGVPALTAYYDTTTPPYSSITLTPNTNTYAPNDTYWVNPDGSGNKVIDASYYVQNDELENSTIVFSGTCLTNTLQSPYTSTVFIKEFDGNYGVINSVAVTPASGQPFSISLTTGGGAHIQYGFETIGPDANPADVDGLGKVTYQVQYPSIKLSDLNSQVAVVGQTVSFAETPDIGAPFTYQWAFNGTNLTDSSHISGATSGALTISNATADDVGTYSVYVTNSTGDNGVRNAQLVLVPFAQAQTNYLIDPGFESGALSSSSTAGWYSFGGSAILSTNDFYPFTADPVATMDGTNCLEVYAGGAYDGAFQDRPASPGEVYTASAWFYTPDADPILGNNACYMEVQFHDAAGNLLMDYQSSQISSNSPMDTWINLQPTNAYDGSFTPVPGSYPFMVAPPNTASVRAQFTYHTVDGTGEVNIDGVSLKLCEPPTTASASNNVPQISFPTHFAPTYQVLYKNNLTDPSWQVLTSVQGDGTVKTVSDSATNPKRFYIVNTQ